MYEKIKTEMKAWLKDYNDIFQLQEEFLLSLLNKFKDTAIGKERGYASIKSIEQFQEIIHLPAGEFDRYILTKTKAGEWTLGQMKLPHLTDRQDFIRFF
ncbi:hypothetical protein NIES593_18325 [Hydrococcus rivularis NIES-593]|uniref:Uncharacterized protein n=1 Tax=Hydrococcus rivularis NIES-593 TaxID=1921803 RepID=A0A1U7HA54_9CYAN|nr:hypothetical protein [Hydrococcus rivularis]OKH20477.1 hypothetical protein NIES593_18325 [Hydrococcus rivularis NIES-593]